jgi:hypothetical protein
VQADQCLKLELSEFLELRQKKAELLSDMYSILDALRSQISSPFGINALDTAYHNLYIASAYFDFYAIKVNGFKVDLKQLYLKEKSDLEKKDGLQASDFQRLINEFVDLFFTKIQSQDRYQQMSTRFNLLLLEASWLVDGAYRTLNGGLHVVE